MSTLKPTALLAGAALVLAGGVITTPGMAFAAPDGNGVSAQVESEPQFKDDELLMAVLFGSGPAANALGIHVEDETLVPEDFERLAAEIVTEFRAERPDATTRAIAAFRSGDPIRVHEEVKALQRTFQKTYVDGAPIVENGALCATVNLVLAGNLAVAINVGVAVTVAFVTWVVTYQVENEASAEVISARLSDLGRA
jgi:SdpC family antimicrobial peptide